MHKNAEGCTRRERVKHVEEKDESVLDYASYIPVGDSAKKLNKWQKQGAEIVYLSSHESENDVDKDKSVLNRYDFPKGDVLWRKDGQEYKDITEEVMPDVLIEDDCESIGGVDEMTITFVSPEKKEQIKSIPIKEFGGIDYLPDDLNDLINLSAKSQGD